MFKIEDKLDHVLFHNGHDIIDPKADPNNLHNQLKGHDMMGFGGGHHFANPMSGGYALPAGILHPGMMSYGDPYGMFYGAGNFHMAAYNYPDHQSHDSDDTRRLRRKRVLI